MEAAQQMIDEDVSSLAVVDAEGYLTGILTRVDLLKSYFAHENWEQVPVRESMVREVVTASPDDLLNDVAQLMLARQIHRVIIVNEENGRKKPVAVVSATDLVYHMVKAA